MKKLSLVLLVAVATALSMGTTSCGPETTNPTPTTTDSTDTGGNIEVVNSVTVGLQAYSIVTEAERTNSTYVTAKDETEIICFGNDAEAGDIDFQITFSGKSTGTYVSNSTGADKVVFGLGTGTEGDVRRQEHDAGSTALTVVVTEYGNIGGLVKGTFSGQVKNQNGQTINISKGIFEVVRKADR